METEETDKYTEWAKSRYTIYYTLYTVYLLLAHPVYLLTGLQLYEHIINISI